MEMHYYLNVYRDNWDRAFAINKTTQDQLALFDRYLRNSINALKSKGEIEAKWEKVETLNLAELRIIGGIYRYIKQTVIEIKGNKKGYYRIKLEGEPDFDEKLKYKIGDRKGEIDVDKDMFEEGLVHIEGIDTVKFDAVIWGFSTPELSPAWCQFEDNTMLYDPQNDTAYKIISIDNDSIIVSGNLPADTRLQYKGMEVSFSKKSDNAFPVKNVNILHDDARETVFYSEKRLGNIRGVEEIKNKEKDFIKTDSMFLDADNTKKLKFELTDNSRGKTIVLANKDDYGKMVYSEGLRFEVIEPNKNNADNYKIRLIEVDNNDDADNELLTLSPLRYFFDEKVNIKDDQDNEYSLDRKNSDKDEMLVVLKRKATKEEQLKGKRWEYVCHPPEGSILKVKIDLTQLERQRSAIYKLKKMPHADHEAIIRLFEKREKATWYPPKQVPENNITEWFVLKDEKRSGCDEQRHFVKIALATNDFAVLEGPPGSGKTTTILELICQLVRRGKRILLCGSTHVSIDNVLQRLIELRDGHRLLDQVDILPVRVGREEKGDEKIAEFKIDNLIGKDGTKEIKDQKKKLLLDAANLVCGTTTGIIGAYPKFKNLTKKDGKPVVPEFDFMIIDESSKTTFQEFLVPALHAKRWILAGDVMQLSPYTEKENVEFNFETISVDGEELGENIQRAVLYLERIRTYLGEKDYGTKNKYPNRFIVPCPQGLIISMAQELLSGRIDKFPDDTIFACITSEELPIKDTQQENEEERRLFSLILFRTPDNVKFLELTTANVILVETAIMDLIQKNLPATHAILGKQDWETMQHAFCHNIHRHRFDLDINRKQYNDGFEISKEFNKELKEGKSWASEIAWRMDRENQLRLAKGDKARRNLDRYSKEIDEYTPFSVDKDKFKEERNSIASMVFPSVLGSLVMGIRGRKTKSESTMSEGFKKEDLEKRKITLRFQHRMHPDISEFPRIRYYQESDALLDLESPRHIRESRNWDYARYSRRSIWVNVDGLSRGGRNVYEVEAMMHHLREFFKYATLHKPPEGKKKWEVACLAFYNRQVDMIGEGDRNVKGKLIEGLQSLPGMGKKKSRFEYTGESPGAYPVSIRLCSVDSIQGDEADIVFLSMSRTDRVGFLDNPNRLNVAITRARFQLVIFGKYDFFSGPKSSDDLKELAEAHKNSVEEWRVPR